MVARAYTVAFEGVEARLVEVQCATSPGMPAFSIVYSNKLTTSLTMSLSENVKATSILIR